MYIVDAHPHRYTHSIRLEQLPQRFQELVQDWASNLARDERLNYVDGEFFMVVPFEMLEVDTTPLDTLHAFTRRFNRLHEVNNRDALTEHVATYPYTDWRSCGEDIDNYLEMLFMLHHLREKLDASLVRPNTLAIFVHD